MISNPRQGQRVRVHYRATVAPHMPHHGKLGIIEMPGRGRPRNHSVRLDDGEKVIIPAGNIQQVKTSQKKLFYSLGS